MKCKNNDTRSNLLTSFATKLTTFPGAVSPKAVLLKRKALNNEIKHYYLQAKLVTAFKNTVKKKQKGDRGIFQS